MMESDGDTLSLPTMCRLNSLEKEEVLAPREITEEDMEQNLSTNELLEKEIGYRKPTLWDLLPFVLCRGMYIFFTCISTSIKNVKLHYEREKEQKKREEEEQNEKNAFYWDEDLDYFSIPLDLETLDIDDLKEIFGDVPTKGKNESMHDVKCASSIKTEEILNVFKSESESCFNFDAASSTDTEDMFGSESTSVYEGTTFCEGEIIVDANKNDSYSSISSSEYESDTASISSIDYDACSEYESDSEFETDTKSILDNVFEDITHTVTNPTGESSLKTYNGNTKMIEEAPFGIEECIENTKKVDNHAEIVEESKQMFQDVELKYNKDILLSTKPAYKITRSSAATPSNTAEQQTPTYRQWNNWGQTAATPSNTAEQQVLTCSPWNIWGQTTATATNTAEQQVLTCRQRDNWGQTNADIPLERPLYRNTWSSAGKSTNKIQTEVQIPICSLLNQYGQTEASNSYYTHVDGLDRVRQDRRNKENTFLSSLEKAKQRIITSEPTTEEVYTKTSCIIEPKQIIITSEPFTEEVYTKTNCIIEPKQMINTSELTTEEVKTRTNDMIETPPLDGLTVSQKYKLLLSETESEGDDIDFTETVITTESNISQIQEYLDSLKRPTCDDTEELDIFDDFKNMLYGEEVTSEDEKLQIEEIAVEETSDDKNVPVDEIAVEEIGLYQSQEEESDDDWDSEDQAEFEEFLNNERFRDRVFNFLYNHPNAVEWLQELIDGNWSQVRYFDFPAPDIIRRRTIWFLFNPKKKKKKKVCT